MQKYQKNMMMPKPRIHGLCDAPRISKSKSRSSEEEKMLWMWKQYCKKRRNYKQNTLH